MFAEIMEFLHDMYSLNRPLFMFFGLGMFCGIVYQLPLRSKEPGGCLFVGTSLVLGYATYGLYMCAYGEFRVCLTCELPLMLLWMTVFPVVMAGGGFLCQMLVGGSERNRSERGTMKDSDTGKQI